MGWRGKYYYRASKVDGKVVREYVGTGKIAELVAQLDAIERDKREDERANLRALREELKATEAMIKELHESTEAFTRALLLAAGYRQHKRGQWRRQRDRHN